MSSFFVPMGGPEFQAQVEAQQAHQHMAQHEQATRIQRFFEELKPEDLVTLIQIFQSIDNSSNAASSASYYMGVCVSVMRLKHQLCICGRDHDKELLEHEEASVEELRIRGQYEKYNVTATGNGSEVRCNNCTLTYVSLADRMVKAPGIEGCHGCQNKAAWG